jgi:class 3 adenylate cyclase
MKLKTRIFTLVGGLFLGSFFLSTALEVFFSRQAAINTNKILDNSLKNYEVRRQGEVSAYLNDRIDILLATINGILERTVTLAYWNYYFAPTDFNVQTNHWLTSAQFLMANKNLDLIQTEISNKLTSEIVLDRPPPYNVHTYDFLGEIKICVVDPQIPNVPIKGPYIGIPYNFDVQVLPLSIGQSPYDLPAESTDIHYLLFTPEQILHFDFSNYNQRIKRFMSIDLKDPENIEYPFNILEISEMKKALPQIKEYLMHAQKYLKNNPGFYNYITEKRETWIQDQFHNLYDIKPGVNEQVDELEVVRVRYNQISMVWQYNSLIATGFSNYEMNDLAPTGLATINRVSQKGSGMIAADILNNKTVEVLAPSIFLGPHNRIFLGNRIAIDLSSERGLRQTILTVGVDLSEVLKGISVVTNRSMIVIVNGQIVAAADEKGRHIQVDPTDFPLATILASPTGFYDNSKGEFIFLTTQLFPNQNVYLVLFSPKAVEFGILDDVSGGLNQLIKHLTLQNIIISILTIVVGAYIISRLSSYITYPIAILAKNTKQVQEGHLEQVNLPDVSMESEDEIEDLYHSFSDMVKGLKEKEKVKGILNKVVSPQIANKILEGNITLGGEEKIVTVLFADIRHFTEMTEKMKPTELIQVLNSYMTRLSDVIDRNNGVIDKYVGDEVMALFGAPISDKDSAASAVNCALEMMEEVAKWNENRLKLGLLPIEIGIGIHTGNVVAGNVGAENRLNYTVLGANVNLAARLCAAADAKQILISQETYNSVHVKDMIEVKELAPIALKGFSQPVNIYSVLPKPTTPMPS